ncbi:MAG TPA: alpha/beta hydrolase [Magnetospirillaceae bacterium]|jgi:pimeloyl-ACP methyl ester carboxylesterase
MPQVKANGIEIEYESFGNEADPVVLLIHGFAAQMTLWPVALCEGLVARGFRVIRFDNRDVGKSTHLLDKNAPQLREVIAQVVAGQNPLVPYRLEDMAADAVGLLDALGIKQAHIVGASMGGMIAQLVAIHYPAKTRSLVSIMSTTAKRGLPQAKPEIMAALVAPPASTGREDRIVAALRAWRAMGNPGYPDSDEQLRARAEREVDRSPWEPTGFTRQMAAIIVAPPRNDLLKDVHAPTLVVHGADDGLVPPEGGKDTADSIPGAELVIVPGMAHDLSEPLVPVVLKPIGAFLTKVEARARVG